MNKQSSRSATVWLLDIRHVREDAMAFFAQRLAASEAHRYANFVRTERKRQFLLGRMLLRLAISNMMSVPVHAITVMDRTESAPALFVADSQSSAPNFSISHSGNWVGCALSTDVMLGLDIEATDPARDILGLSEAAFQHDEQLWLTQQPDAERVAAFYRLWSTREALYKLISSLGHEMPSSSLISAGDNVASQGCWHARAVTHQSLTIVVCSDQPIAALAQGELSGLTPADLLGAGQALLPAVRRLSYSRNPPTSAN